MRSDANARGGMQAAGAAQCFSKPLGRAGLAKMLALMEEGVAGGSGGGGGSRSRGRVEGGLLKEPLEEAAAATSNTA